MQTYHLWLLLVVVCGVSGLPPSVTPAQSGPHAHPCQQAQDELPATQQIHTKYIINAINKIFAHIKKWWIIFEVGEAL